MNVGRGGRVSESGELWLLRELDRRLWSKRPGPVVVFDVGANSGDYAVAVRRLLGDELILHAFEPSAHAFAKLERACPPSSNVHLHKFGLSDETATVTLYGDAPGSGLGSLYARELAHVDIPYSAQERVELKGFGEFMREAKVDRIDLLKLDVEGHELAVLRAAKDVLAEARVDVIQFEFGGCNIDSRTYFRDFWLLLSPHFELFRLAPRGLVHLPKYREIHENFITTNFVAMRKGWSMA